MPVASSPPALPLVLRKRIHLMSARYNAWLLGLIALILLSPFVLLALAARDEAEAWQSAGRMVAGDPRLWLVLVGGAVMGVFFWCTARYERLTLTESGIEYRTPFRGPLGFLRSFKPDWRLGWADIRDARLRKGMRLPKTRATRRQIELLQRRRLPPKVLDPYLWYQWPDPAGLTFREVINLRDERYLEAVEASPLYRVLADRGLLGTEKAPSGDQDPDAAPDEAASPYNPLEDLPGGSYDLTSHPGMLALLGGLVVLGGYAVVDGFFLAPWRYLEAPPAGAFTVAAVAAGIVGTLASRSAPTLERWALVALFALAAAGAVYPGMLRVNAATDPDGISAYRYRQVDVGRFEPVDRYEMPTLVFDRGMEFWESLPPDGEREFRLARGTPGFWQLDLNEVRAAQRAFYRGRDAADE